MTAVAVVLVIVGIGLVIFAAYRLGYAHGTADRISADVDRRVLAGLAVVTGPRCGWSWPTSGAAHIHVCASAERHAMEHRCVCGALYPS